MAWSMSAMMSLGFSSPMDRRIVVGRIPAMTLSSGVNSLRVVLIGSATSERTSPMFARYVKR